MLQKDVKIGGEYLVKVGGQLVRCRVEQRVCRFSSFDSGREVVKFRLRNLRTGRELKLSTSQRLREIPQPTENAIHCKWCRQGFVIEPTVGYGTRESARERDAKLATADGLRDAHEAACSKNPDRGPDVLVHGRGSDTVFAFELISSAARAWVDANVQGETSWLGDRLVVEHRYAGLLAEGLREAGFIVR